MNENDSIPRIMNMFMYLFVHEMCNSLKTHIKCMYVPMDRENLIYKFAHLSVWILWMTLKNHIVSFPTLNLLWRSHAPIQCIYAQNWYLFFVLLFACVSFLKDILLNFENLLNILLNFKFWKTSQIFLIIKKIAILGTRNNLEQFTE